MSERAILEALQGGVTAAVAASDTPTLPVKYVMADSAFTVPDDQKYLELVHLPNNRDGDFWGDERNDQGIFRLILHWPNDGAGAYGPLDVLESICSHFTKGLILQPVKISAIPNLTGVLEAGQENLFPASIRYQSFRR